MTPTPKAPSTAELVALLRRKAHWLEELSQRKTFAPYSRTAAAETVKEFRAVADALAAAPATPAPRTALSAGPTWEERRTAAAYAMFRTHHPGAEFRNTGELREYEDSADAALRAGFPELATPEGK